ncbi:MAG: hypothetical protein R2710_22610, partial [Acidimicrobiales bacterium]
PIHYDATFVIDSIELRPDETFADLHARLSVGRTPPPMVAIITSASDGETRPIERFIPVAVDASTLNLRRLISALRTARELHRSSRLDQLLAVLRADLAPDEQGRVPLQSALDSLRDAIDVLGAHLLITSEADSVQWEVASGDDLDPEDHSASRQPVSTGFTPVLAVRRTTPSLSAALLLGPLSANSQARIRPGLVAFVNLILERIQLASERRASEREGIVHQLFDDGAEANVVIGRSSRRRAPDPTTESALRLRQALTDGLPQLAPAVIDALLRHDLTLVHQPIMDSTGRIIESDMLLGAPLPLPQAAGHAETIDLLPLDSLESEAAAMVTSEVAIPIGHWLITRACPRCSVCRTDHELEPEHRVHLACSIVSWRGRNRRVDRRPACSTRSAAGVDRHRCRRANAHRASRHDLRHVATGRTRCCALPRWVRWRRVELHAASNLAGTRRQAVTRRRAGSVGRRAASLDRVGPRRPVRRAGARDHRNGRRPSSRPGVAHAVPARETPGCAGRSGDDRSRAPRRHREAGFLISVGLGLVVEPVIRAGRPRAMPD